MGAAVGGRLRDSGHRVLTVANGRGPETLARINENRLEVATSLQSMLAEVDVLLSIVPPSVALEVAQSVQKANSVVATRFLFVECNAVAPEVVRSIGTLFANGPVTVVDGGIVGPPPRGVEKPRLYLSGSAAEHVDALTSPAFEANVLGTEIGTASALKLTYAAVTKGINALLAASLVAADRYNVLDALVTELQGSQPAVFSRIEANMSRLPADAARWAPELRFIADAFAAVGLPDGFHLGGAHMFDLLADSIFGAETRRTRDTSRDALATIRGISRPNAPAPD